MFKLIVKEKHNFMPKILLYCTNDPKTVSGEAHKIISGMENDQLIIYVFDHPFFRQAIMGAYFRTVR